MPAGREIAMSLPGPKRFSSALTEVEDGDGILGKV